LACVQLLIGFQKWIHVWFENGWKNALGFPVKNKELIQYISSLIISRYNRYQNVHMENVEGHSGDFGNDGADALAVAGCWKPEVPERNWVLELEMNLTEDTDKHEEVDIETDVRICILVASYFSNG
jgi:ribonuclease HI